MTDKPVHIHQRREDDADIVALQKGRLIEALAEYFDDGVDRKKFIDTSRIPLICQDIKNIHLDISDIKDTLKWIARLVIGAVVLALLGVIFVNK